MAETVYDRARATAAFQIKDKGRLITLRQEASNYNAATGQNDVKRTDFPVYGLFTNIEQSRVDGTVIKSGDKELLVASEGLSVEPSSDFLVIDGSVTWHVEQVNEIKPGPLSVMWKLVTRR